MSSGKCPRCGAALNTPASVCPACGTPTPTSIEPALPAPKAVTHKLPFLVLVLGVVALLAMVLFFFLNTVQPPDNPATQTAKPVDLNAVRSQAEAGNAGAQKDLGKLYSQGEGVKQDYKEAARWYHLAADHGNGAAQLALGELYEAGQGVPRDLTEAANWYRRSAEQGDAAGQYSVAVMYLVGSGVPKDDGAALKWYRRSADQGYALAMFHLGMRYKKGQGVTADPVEAYKWLNLAGARGIAEANEILAELKRSMTRDQVAEGRRRVEAFVVKSEISPAK